MSGKPESIYHATASGETEHLLRSPRNRRRLLRSMKCGKHSDDVNPRPFRPVSPGEILRGEIEARGWTQKEPAERCDTPYLARNRIIRGRKRLTAATALTLAAARGTSAGFGMNLESNDRLVYARREMRRNKRP